MASAATGYSDYFKNNSSDGSDSSDTDTMQGATIGKALNPDEAAKQARKKALLRRLATMKTTPKVG